MEIGSSTSTNVKQAAETFVLKKAMAVSSATMQTLMASVEQSAPKTNNPAHLGQNVDVKA
jgi:hypothetical protein